MSMRTLIEINHDYAHVAVQPEMLAFLARYLASGSREDAERLQHYGIRILGMRHHSDKFIIDGNADGFPPLYLNSEGKLA